MRHRRVCPSGTSRHRCEGAGKETGNDTQPDTFTYPTFCCSLRRDDTKANNATNVELTSDSHTVQPTPPRRRRRRYSKDTVRVLRPVIGRLVTSSLT